MFPIDVKHISSAYSSTRSIARLVSAVLVQAEGSWTPNPEPARGWFEPYVGDADVDRSGPQKHRLAFSDPPHPTRRYSRMDLERMCPPRKAAVQSFRFLAEGLALPMPADPIRCASTFPSVTLRFCWRHIVAWCILVLQPCHVTMTVFSRAFLDDSRARYTRGTSVQP